MKLETQLIGASAARRGSIAAISIAAACLILAGCSAKDPETKTPAYHGATPTNMSSVQSWELYTEPYYTQPGVNGGRPVAPPISRHHDPLQFESYNPLAQSVYSALGSANVNVKYVTATADGVGDVVLQGTVPSVTALQTVMKVASSVKGVKHVKNALSVSNPQLAQNR